MGANKPSKNDTRSRSYRQDDLARVFDARVRVKARFIYDKQKENFKNRMELFFFSLSWKNT